MKSYKPLIIIVVVLLLFNCGLIAMLWYTNYHHNKQPVVIRGTAYDYLTNVLKLTPQQVKQYDTLRNKHHEFTQKIQEEQRMQRDSFFDNLKNQVLNPAQVSALEKRILINQGKLDSGTYYHFKNFRAILNTGQQTKFDEVLQDVLHTMNQQHPQGGQQSRLPGADPDMHNGSQNAPHGWPPPGNKGHRHRPPPQGGQNDDDHHRHGPPDGFPSDGPPPNGPPSNGFPPPKGPPPNGPPPLG